MELIDRRCDLCGNPHFLINVKEKWVCENCLHVGLEQLISPWRKSLNSLMKDYLGTCLRCLTSDDPEDVHKARVTGRKIRALLEFLGVPKNHPLLAIIKIVHKHLNKVREADVLLNEMQPLSEINPVYKEICDLVLKKQRRQKSTLAKEFPLILDDFFQKHITDFFENELNPYVLQLNKEIVLSQLEDRFNLLVDHYHQLVDELGKTALPSIKALHAVRIHSKSLRYTYHFLNEDFGENLLEKENEYKNLQNQFGDINDVQDWLHQVKAYQNQLHAKKRDIDHVKSKLEARLLHLIEKVEIPKRT